MISGGDLDGDQYIVIWDKQLVPTISYEAMIYDDINIPINEKEINDDAIHNYYMK